MRFLIICVCLCMHAYVISAFLCAYKCTYAYTHALVLCLRAFRHMHMCVLIICVCLCMHACTVCLLYSFVCVHAQINIHHSSAFMNIHVQMNHVSFQEAVLKAIKRNKEGRADYLKWEFKEGNHIPVTAKLPRKGLEGQIPIEGKVDSWGVLYFGGLFILANELTESCMKSNSFLLFQSSECCALLMALRNNSHSSCPIRRTLTTWTNSLKAFTNMPMTLQKDLARS